jgi:competence protein ComEA
VAKSKSTDKSKIGWSRQRLYATFQDFFLLPERERKGLRVMMVVMIGIWAFRFWGVDYLPQRNLEIGVSDRRIIEGQIRQWENSSRGAYYSSTSTQIKLDVKSFDPNKVDQAMLGNMGFPEALARRWANYVKAGGKFRRPDDLLKLYGLDSSIFSQIKDSLIFSLTQEGVIVARPSRSSYAVVELNSADSIALCALPGIGPVLTSRILKYRARLGGFASPEQLVAVYGMDSLRLQSLLPFLKADTMLVQPCLLNQSDYNALVRHPLMSRNLAYDIIEWRRVHGKLKSLDDLQTFRTMSPEEKQKLRLYFKP